VDHNEFSQSVDGIDKAEIIGVLDHHKIDFQYESPLIFVSLPWGAACSIVAQGFFDRDMAPGKNLAGLMLSAILVDTVITKSPTCTKHDKRIITRLADIAGIKDWKKFGMELFKIRSNVNKSSAVDIIKGDFKDFQTNIGKVGIGQVETVDLNEFKDREDELLQKLQEIKESEDYHTVILFITDIMQEGSQFLVATSDQEKVKEALGSELEDNKVYLPGVISRKKQVAPNFTSVFNK
jgi:manganese-dependent inorganic pyrophosphatase